MNARSLVRYPSALLDRVILDEFDCAENYVREGEEEEGHVPLVTARVSGNWDEALLSLPRVEKVKVLPCPGGGLVMLLLVRGGAVIFENVCLFELRVQLGEGQHEEHDVDG